MRPLLIANWKMIVTAKDVRAFLRSFKAPRALDVMIAAPAVMIPAVKQAGFATAGQQVSTHESGAYTGEISAQMLRDAGCSASLAGHSERRLYHGETDEEIAEQIQRIAEARLIPVLCVGETAGERKRGQTKAVLRRQLTKALKGTTLPHGLVVAYEPVWAISGFSKKAVSATPADIASAHAYIRHVLQSRYGSSARRVRVIYGGSVNPSNAAEIFATAGVDGGLVGSASTKAKDFSIICKALA